MPQSFSSAKRWNRVIAAASACSAVSILILLAMPSRAQQPARPAHRRVFHGFSQPEPIDFNNHAGWTSMFDGSTLNGWDGDTAYWRVENGAITVESTCEKPTGTIYLVWKGGEPADFEMKLEMRGEGADVNSGIQYRGAILSPENSGLSPAPPKAEGVCPSGQPRGVPPSKASQAKWDMLGPQFDFDGRNMFTGQFYEQATGRGIVAWRGQMVETEEDKKPRLIAKLGDPEALGG
ncbi:MAG: 3-keto-disaccharide hydrolase, partial [Bryobacteraceae bacterium]